jgi:two-component system KDP operon response regulator KdpE
MAGKILVIDDDRAQCELARLCLVREGYEVEVAYDSHSGLRQAFALQPDVVILDIMLPDMSGWEVCRRLREMSDVPILMLTALGSPEDVVKGLKLGADGYLVKPATTGELVARINNLMRRASSPDVAGGAGYATVIQRGRVIIDLSKREVTVEGKRVDLSPTEFRLLAVLVRNVGHMVPHDKLLAEVWGPAHVGEVEQLRLYISYLRRKLEDDPAHPELIHTEWGLGYRFE